MKVVTTFAGAIEAGVSSDELSPNSQAQAAGRKLTRYALAIGAMRFPTGGFMTKAGRLTPHFFDASHFSQGKDWDELAKAFAATIAVNFAWLGRPEALFGPAYKGIPIATAVAVVLYRDYGISLEVVFDRKEAKDHGEGGDLIGKPIKGRRVLLLDDVLSIGKAKREAAALIRTHEGMLVGCVIALDRQERDGDDTISAVQRFAQDAQIPVIAVATLDDLILELEEGHTVADSAAKLAEVLAYRDQYGVN